MVSPFLLRQTKNLAFRVYITHCGFTSMDFRAARLAGTDKSQMLFLGLSGF
jgi:hypothetical protein